MPERDSTVVKMEGRPGLPPDMLRMMAAVALLGGASDQNELAAALGNLAILHAQLERGDKALAAAQEAVELRRRASVGQRDASQPTLAAALAVLDVLQMKGRVAAALAVARESESLFALFAQRWGCV